MHLHHKKERSDEAMSYCGLDLPLMKCWDSALCFLSLILRFLPINVTVMVIVTLPAEQLCCCIEQVKTVSKSWPFHPLATKTKDVNNTQTSHRTAAVGI